ncbi:MAG: hypothetical protein SVW57_08350 [Thermodesulfobacteriota bacterium]|nr:hypothetical protein [Thermodesulfobacteriota bacterium]
MKYKRLIFFLTIIYLLPLELHAHGVRGKVDTGGIVVTAQYDTGKAMNYAKVKISVPNSNLTFQLGRTDRNGRFCFFPDISGDWKVTVDDEMGHHLEVMVPVNEKNKLKTKQSTVGLTEGSFSRCERAFMGISVIFGIFGCLLGWKGYKKAKKGISKE